MPASARLERDTDALTQGLVSRVLTGAIAGTNLRAGLVLLDTVLTPGGQPIKLASLGLPAGLETKGLLATNSVSIPPDGPTVLAGAAAAALAGPNIDVGSVLENIRSALQGTRLDVFAQLPAQQAWLVGGPPPAAAAPPPAAAAAAPAPVPPPAPIARPDARPRAGACRFGRATASSGGRAPGLQRAGRAERGGSAARAARAAAARLLRQQGRRAFRVRNPRRDPPLPARNRRRHDRAVDPRPSLAPIWRKVGGDEMGLRAKFNLVMLVAFLVGLGLAGGLSYVDGHGQCAPRGAERGRRHERPGQRDQQLHRARDRAAARRPVQPPLPAAIRPVLGGADQFPHAAAAIPGLQLPRRRAEPDQPGRPRRPTGRPTSSTTLKPHRA